jgi:putative SOS response-associated peptidase YedK
MMESMCGRYSLEAGPDEIAEAFALADAIAFSARYNIAPTQNAPVVRSGPDATGRRLDVIRWGLTPAWAKGPRPIINARSESVAEKPSFRSAFRRRRCLVPATGFYEWQKLGRTKQPFHVRLRDRGVFAFAGIWDTCPDADGNPVEAFAILTCAPNETMKPIHNRMPVILDAGDYPTWLDPGIESGDVLAALMVPAPHDRLSAYPVTGHVNSPAHDDARCVEPAAWRDSASS